MKFWRFHAVLKLEFEVRKWYWLVHWCTLIFHFFVCTFIFFFFRSLYVCVCLCVCVWMKSCPALAISKWLCSVFHCYFFTLHVFIFIVKFFWARNKDCCCCCWDVHQTVAHQPGEPFWGQSTVWWCSKPLFILLIPL